jgi:hypothetical protein
MTHRQHAVRVIGLMAIAAGMLITMAVRADLIFADGLRYIEQAQRISRGAISDGLVRSIDHPGYPLAIAAVHTVLDGADPAAWQRAAQAAAVLAGVLLVIPLYLMAIELFGPRIAWLCCLLVYLAPIPCRVMADAMSESTFLLFWTWGLWAAIRFLKEGSLGWLPLLVGCGVSAYLTRPEGMLLPAALVATLVVMPLFPATRLSWPRWGAAFGFLMVAPLCVVGPYVVAKGGLGTKPALARVLGTASTAPPDSVERARPLDPNQSQAKTYFLAVKGTAGALTGAISIPLLAPVALGIWARRSAKALAATRLFLVFIVLGALLALVRLHATCGYCTSRHAILLGLLLIPTAAAGLDWLLRRVPLPTRAPAQGAIREPWAALFAVAAALYLAWSAPSLLRPLNHEGTGYRLAGEWLADRTHAPEDAKVVDGPGWSLFYGKRTGYTFANLNGALGDPQARFVVVREAHLLGPGSYCQIFRDLVRGLQPVLSFPDRPDKTQSRVFLFDRQQLGSPESGVAGREPREKRVR